MKSLLNAAFLVSFAVGATDALANHHPGAHQPDRVQAPAVGQKSTNGTGLIQQIDRDKGVITIKHGPLQGLNMPPMTMSFLVKDKAVLSSLQPLQKVEFELTFDGRQYLITSIK